VAINEVIDEVKRKNNELHNSKG